jgi:two-component system phosphate regulon sensor histidine kinase PhoR
MEAGRKVYELRRERVSDLLEDVLRAFAPHRELRAEVDLAVEIAPDVPDVVVDRAAMATAIVNLLSNAQKYGGTPPEVRLRVGTNSGGHEVRIAVTDNGGGIPRPEHRRIFEKFYRIDDRLSRTQEGSGLGLAIVNHIARAHRARVLVDSAEGEGSTFTIVLDAAPRPVEHASAEASARAE